MDVHFFVFVLLLTVNIFLFVFSDHSACRAYGDRWYMLRTIMVPTIIAFVILESVILLVSLIAWVVLMPVQ